MNTIAKLLFILLFSLSVISASDIPRLTVRGKSELKKKADETTLFLGIVSDEATVEEALRKNSSSMQKVLSSLEIEGLSADEWETGQFQITPQYSREPNPIPRNWKPVLQSYQVSNKIKIRTRQMQKVGQWIDRAVKNGANDVDSVIFGLYQPERFRAEAINAASLNAIRDARELADSLGVKLKRILSATLDSNEYVPVVRNLEAYPMAKMSYTSIPPLAGGDVDLRAAVTLVFEIDQE